MGPSGAGKTTFLSILAGKVAKTEGSIRVNGKEQTLSLWKRLIGFVPQEDVMLSELTVREILMVCKMILITLSHLVQLFIYIITSKTKDSRK